MARYFGTTAEFWINLQAHYDLSISRRQAEEKIKRDVRPMDLADAALVRVAEREGLRKIFTVDRRDFSVYRINHRSRPILIP